MQKIKIVQSGWEGFTGLLGMVDFKDGVSVDPVPEMLADRITGLIQCESVPEDGSDPTALGIATRLIGGATISATVEAALERQTDREREIEDNIVKIQNSKEVEQELYTKVQLEAVVEKDGLPGLRKIGDVWQVRDRAIPKLIEKILIAQNEFVARREQALAAAAGAANADRVIEVIEPQPQLNPEEPFIPLATGELTAPKPVDSVEADAAAGDSFGVIFVNDDETSDVVDQSAMDEPEQETPVVAPEGEGA